MSRLQIFFLISLLCVAGCGPSGSSHDKPSPAKVEKQPQETEIARITLTEKAEQRLGITLANVAWEKVPRRRTLGGLVMIPNGKSSIVTAPVPGTIAPPDDASIPLAGIRVNVGDALLTLVPLLSPERYVPTPAERVQMANARATLLSAQTVAEGDVDRGRREVEATKIALDRAEQLLRDMAGSAKSVDDARALYNIANATYRAAENRHRQLTKLAADLENPTANGNAAALVMTSPQTGVIRNLAVERGQTVTPGTALLEVVDTETMWVRVPVYVDLVADIQTDADAHVVGLDGRSTVKTRVARAIVSPPSADPLNTTVDLFFEVDNSPADVPADNQAAFDLRPGQRVGVELVMRGEAESLVVPAKSILYDIYGGTWVYVKVDEHAFERRRVQVRYTAASRVVLESGPAKDTQVVVDGAAEIFGTEFGSKK